MILSNKFVSGSQDFSTFENRLPAPWFKKDIHLSGDIEKAEITVCGLGFYELFVNGKRITKGYLSPYITNSDDVVFYDNYDITDLLTIKNELKFLLGNGMQNAFGGFQWDFEKAAFRSSPKLAFAVEITYKDGTQEIIEADESVFTKSSKIISDDLRLGEIYDATKENLEWENAILVSSPKGEKRLSIAKPITVRDELNPIKICQEDHAYIYDFGINTSGVCRLHINAKAGQKITLTFGEILVNGKFSKENTTFS
ncbi:MAG: family 78 glycoside hydrolase catalytic domain, partial [Eubacterium sp.]|nr:family 78 glycoside hydrolase catalytic domain [Eubacterium sp.]